MKFVVCCSQHQGPFRQTPPEQIRTVTQEQALAHPTWKMGSKITIDSATLMNKAFEVIEAHWQFNIPYARIDVIIHLESIIHSMVDFIDGTVKMLAGPTTMCLPILSALSYPARLNIAGTELPQALNWTNIAQLRFEALDTMRFPCFPLAPKAVKQGGTYPCALVDADEETVTLFLEGKIGLLDIAPLINAVLEQHESVDVPDISTFLEVYAWARRATRALYGSLFPITSHITETTNGNM